MSAFEVETIGLDLPHLAAEFAARLHAAGVPAGVDRTTSFAHTLRLVRPESRRRLYWAARAIFITDRSQLPAFNRVFAEVFGTSDGSSLTSQDLAEMVSAETFAAPPDARPVDQREALLPPLTSGAAEATVPSGDRDENPEPEQEALVPVLASDEELLRGKRFESLEPAELAQLYRLMERLRIETPLRRTRRSRRDRHGRRIDLRRTMRASMRTGGDPLRLARRSRRVVPRRIVLLCDISGSMEPYARAYLQFLTSAAGGAVGQGGQVEAFVFATRLTRLTRALASRSPERAIQRAAEIAPDWSSGTRIGDALKRFNDRHGRRGLARGAVVVILSDGWERGEPALVAQEMQRLSRLAHRIIWVNPRAGAPGFAPRAGGMVAALPYCDALVSGESLAALEAVIRAIGCEPKELPGTAWTQLGTSAGTASPAPEEPDETEDEPWGSATPVRGSSVAMPSGWSPSRGKTTPGWGIHDH
jgi:uncharacterized protein